MNPATYDAPGWSECSSLTVSGDGIHHIYVAGTDASNNKETPHTRTFTIDTTRAERVLTQRPVWVSSDTTATVGFRGEEGATFSCSLDHASVGHAHLRPGAVTRRSGNERPPTHPSVLDQGGPRTLTRHHGKR